MPRVIKSRPASNSKESEGARGFTRDFIPNLRGKEESTLKKLEEEGGLKEMINDFLTLSHRIYWFRRHVQDGEFDAQRGNPNKNPNLISYDDAKKFIIEEVLPIVNKNIIEGEFKPGSLMPTTFHPNGQGTKISLIYLYMSLLLSYLSNLHELEMLRRLKMRGKTEIDRGSETSIFERLLTGIDHIHEMLELIIKLPKDEFSEKAKELLDQEKEEFIHLYKQALIPFYMVVQALYLSNLGRNKIRDKTIVDALSVAYICSLLLTCVNNIDEVVKLINLPRNEFFKEAKRLLDQNIEVLEKNEDEIVKRIRKNLVDAKIKICLLNFC